MILCSPAIFAKGRKYKCEICGKESIDKYKWANKMNQRIFCDKCAEKVYRKLK